MKTETGIPFGDTQEDISKRKLSRCRTMTSDTSNRRNHLKTYKNFVKSAPRAADDVYFHRAGFQPKRDRPIYLPLSHPLHLYIDLCRAWHSGRARFSRHPLPPVLYPCVRSCPWKEVQLCQPSPTWHSDYVLLWQPCNST